MLFTYKCHTFAHNFKKRVTYATRILCSIQIKI